MRKSNLHLRYLTAVALSVFTLAPITLTGCTKDAGITHDPAASLSPVEVIMSSSASDSETVFQVTEETTVSETSAIMTNAANGADIDLTTMSANMVYAQVFSMVMEPDGYIGLTVRMEGQFVFYHDEEKDKNYFACIIRDATACCAQGLEFEPSSDFTYPDDFPEDGETIRVLGVFDKYEEDGNTYLTLRDAVIEPAGQTA